MGDEQDHLDGFLARGRRCAPYCANAPSPSRRARVLFVILAIKGGLGQGTLFSSPFSLFLTHALPAQLMVDLNRKDLPIFWGHGIADPFLLCVSPSSFLPPLLPLTLFIPPLLEASPMP